MPQSARPSHTTSVCHRRQCPRKPRSGAARARTAQLGASLTTSPTQTRPRIPRGEPRPPSGWSGLLPSSSVLEQRAEYPGARARLRTAESGKVRPVASGLEIEQLPDARGIRLAGDLDFSTAPRFTDAVSAFELGDELRLDLAELILVDSAGLHALLGLARTRANRSLILLDPPASVMRSFEIAGIDKHPAIEIRQAGAARVPSRTRKTSHSLRRAG